MTARSPLECRLYIELHPCDCGGSVVDLTDRVVRRDETLCARYTGRCSACGKDPGQYLAASERAARQVRPGGPLEDRASARSLLGRAIACLEEVMKWIPPGEDRVPASAFFTEEGRRVHSDEPGRFCTARLVAVLSAYREMWLRTG